MNIYSSVFLKLLIQPILNQMKIFYVTTSKLILVDGTNEVLTEIASITLTKFKAIIFSLNNRILTVKIFMKTLKSQKEEKGKVFLKKLIYKCNQKSMIIFLST